MANFVPLKNYFFFCLSQIMRRYSLKPPFLDVGCGIGDLAKYLAEQSWQGKAIDFGEQAVEAARFNLASYPNIQVENKSFFEETEKFSTIFLWDVIEHIKNDREALAKAFTLLNYRGYLVVSVPTNSREWRWDDDFYGHWRRYSPQEFKQKLIEVGFKPILSWDTTYPFFWIMRRIYTRIKPLIERLTRNHVTASDRVTSAIFSDAKIYDQTMLERTKASSGQNAWNIPWLASALNHDFWFWRLIYKTQFLFFKHKVNRGHEMIVVAQKMDIV